VRNNGARAFAAVAGLGLLGWLITERMCTNSRETSIRLGWGLALGIAVGGLAARR